MYFKALRDTEAKSTKLRIRAYFKSLRGGTFPRATFLLLGARSRPLQRLIYTYTYTQIVEYGADSGGLLFG
ncbi:hypothetical protein TSAR_001151 [Trichomalopsis sarcophagae]|uniref:Uncharacterized protein n=1 Tax=Trichomalopsis sarcophagae TaxID=543379 RepID=A0A232EV16_9HYME|nr:hypothetical protein TSAR_001151 [Trichomalopsis sarcophagae]